MIAHRAPAGRSAGPALRRSTVSAVAVWVALTSPWTLAARPERAAAGVVPLAGADDATPESACHYYDDDSVIDVLAVYTTEARDENGSNDIHAYIKAHADIMNLCLANSHAFPRIRIVSEQELSGYDDPNDNQLSIQRLLDPSDGYLDEVHTLRDAVHADLVVMIAKCLNCGGTAACNTSDQYILTESGGFAILSADWDPPTAWGMAHELAHTMGCGHNRDAENIGPGLPVNCRSYSYSYGYDFIGNSGRWHSTIMSYGPTLCGSAVGGDPCVLYNNSCPAGSPCGHLPPPKIFYYSNPAVLFDGQPTGAPVGSPNAADNVATINDNAFLVSNFRTHPGNIWVEFPYMGTELGCFENPYNTVAEGVSAVPPDGTLILKAGSTSTPATIQGSKRFTMKAFAGAARLGG